MRFSYVKYDEESVMAQETFKVLFETLEKAANKLLQEGRAKSLFMTKIEEAYMWTEKSIRDQQIARDSQPQHTPERG